MTTCVTVSVTVSHRQCESVQTHKQRQLVLVGQCCELVTGVFTTSASCFGPGLCPVISDVSPLAAGVPVTGQVKSIHVMSSRKSKSKSGASDSESEPTVAPVLTRQTTRSTSPSLRPTVGGGDTTAATRATPGAINDTSMESTARVMVLEKQLAMLAASVQTLSHRVWPARWLHSLMP